MEEDSIINVIANNNYIVVNRSLIKEFGLKEAVLLGELASEYNYYKKNNLLDDKGYFYSTIENVKDNTTLSSYEQKKCLDSLSKRNIVDVVVKGIPATRYIKINSYQLVNLFTNNLETSFQKIKKLDVKKLGTNNNNIKNNNKNNNKEIYKEICKRVITKLNELNDTKYSPTSEGNIKFIKGRLQEGYTEEDLMLVVEKMSYLWNQPSEKDMRQYLRPSTLFRPTNFENYLNMPIKEQKITSKELATKMDFTDFIAKGMRK